mmetsp:Transcript_37989/g.63110  ORF Transcript_37989/g.63110 Transcript_37989/m.63110 type:complete len:175 (-) Transcript_37989:307-831(-)
MAIAVVSWVQDRLGCDILGVVPETPEEAAKADSLKYITRISTRIVSLKDDLNRSLEECQAKLEHEDKPSIDGLREMEELYKFQNDVFTKQLYEVDNVVGDDEVRQSRKHCNTEIQVCLKDIEIMQGVLKECLQAGHVLPQQVIKRKLSTLSRYDIPSTLDPKTSKGPKKAAKKD